MGQWCISTSVSWVSAALQCTLAEALLKVDIRLKAVLTLI
jgi:hypothetical protein